MTFPITWIVHDPDESDRVNRILAALKQGEARDELGMGGIRDSLADLLFPGTSTIQTRLRYFLIVAWCYRQMELRGTRAPRFGRAVADIERTLIPVLASQPDAGGVFGRVAGQSVKRLPSSVYWNGLGKWGIRAVGVSQSEYHRTVDRYIAGSRRTRTTEDGEQWTVMPKAIWHRNLPDIPEGFPDQVDFRVLPDEADFLVRRIHDNAAGTLLDWLVQRPEKAPDVAGAQFPWELPCRAELSDDLQGILRHARLVSLVTHGAAQLYNLMLAEVDAGDDHADGIAQKRRDDLDAWRKSLDRIWAELDAWDHDELGSLCARATGHTVTPQTWTFLRHWTDRVLSKDGRVEDDKDARRLVKSRERALKGRRGRSRFDNPTLRGQWQGEAGLGRLDFRWRPVQGLLDDLYAALSPEEGA